MQDVVRQSGSFSEKFIVCRVVVRREAAYTALVR